MPTPVSAVRQCLSGEAAAALDEAVAVARRRAHAQTTSLHIVSALLSLPTSPSSSSFLLRDALYRARSAAYAPRLQLKALEFSFSSALDRLPSPVPCRKGAGDGNAQQEPPAEPPVSNSLMAAIKRSQANQRRNPDTFHLYQQQQLENNNYSYSSFAGVKVELRQLVLSILDDPVVSRVFGEAGFRSCDVKFAILRPPSSLLRFPRAARCPPLFLCNFSVAAEELDVAPRGCPFPFSNQPLYSDGADENCGRITQVLVKGRSPLLVGVGASEAARDFERALVGQKWAAFPPELRGTEFFSIEKVISEFVRDDRRRPWLGTRFGEVGLWLAAATERRPSPGIVLGLGELEALVDMVWEAKEGDGLGGASYVVAELSKLVEGHPGKLWLMGSVATYETYMKFLAHYPYLDKDWDLQLLPVTSLKPGSAGLCSRPSRSSVFVIAFAPYCAPMKAAAMVCLMESFVPFGGLYPVANNSVAPLITQSQPEVPCHLCNDKYDQEIAALLNEFCVSVEERWHENLPQLQKIDPNSINEPQDVEKAKDDGTILNAKVMNLRKKWGDICQRLHQGSRILERETLVESNAFPHVVSIPCVAVEESSCNEYFPSKLQSGHSNSAQFQPNSSTSHSGGLSDASAPDEHNSSSPMVSVSTDLVLGTVHYSSSKEENSIMHLHNKHSCELPACLVSKVVDVINGNASTTPQYSSCLAYSDSPMITACLPLKEAFGPKAATDKRKLCSSNACEPFDIRDLKAFCSSLAEKVSWQEEAARSIGQTLARCRTGNERTRGVSLRGDIWLGFLGPDRVGKRKIAVALAQLLFSGREKLIVVDLSLQSGLVPSSAVCSNQDANGGLSFRGKTVVDHIADEISKKPCSVVLLENVDKADLLVQGSISQAIKTGKFSDSYRRDVSINNAVFVVTAGVKGKTDFLNRQSKFSEDQILAARPQKMMITVDYACESTGRILSPDAPGREPRSRQVYVGKRKLNMADSGKEQYGPARSAKQAKGTTNTLLDLNLPVEEIVPNHRAYSGDEGSSISENTETWLEEFLDTVDETVFFKPFDFDALADDVLNEISGSFQSAMRSNGVLEIDPRVMEQILAAVWLSEDRAALSNWVQQVLVRSFMEARQIHKLSTQMVLRLVAGEDVFMEDHVPGILLPSHVLLG
ncbi:hypothetical protein Taro_049798 [Colocasia esculenta]|uniref:Clp R domain-containing protein n=1 Tax=Colocasia esculenta TaxID=4460 RepID=A0A843XBQ7_COLES|nr:hypothetical protein [Colocasia esculenta]